MSEKKDPYWDAAKPVKIGVLMDVPERHYRFVFPLYDFIVDRYINSGRFHRRIELVRKIVYGPPAGYIADVMKGYHELCDEGVLAVIGPNHSDSNLAITAHAEARQVPVMSLGAIHSHVSEYVFNVCWGAVPEDGHIVASWLVQNGHKRVTLTYDVAAHCKIYAQYFRQACERNNIKILAQKCHSDVNDKFAEEEMRRTVVEHRALNPDAIVCFGTGASQLIWGRVVHEAKWDVPRIMNGVFFQANYSYTHEFFDGWVGTGLWDDDNPTLNKLRKEFKQAYPALGEPEVLEVPPELLAIYRDGMVALLEGVLAASILTPEGVKHGLETVTHVPAASGGPRTVITFGPNERRGLRGMDLMVLRRLNNGKLVMEGRFEPNLENTLV